MKKIKFLHMADFHYGARVASEPLGLNSEKLSQRKKEERDVLQKIIETAIAEKVNLILLPGDVYDFTASSQSAINDFFDRLRMLDEIPVFISPGNHDFYAPHSFYNPEFLLARNQNPIPENVYVFRDSSFHTIIPEKLPSITISGFAYAGFTNINERPLDAPIDRDKSKINILLLHGWFDQIKVDKGLQTSPFSIKELEMQDFDYAALGHIHSYMEIRSSTGRLVGAYPGAPFGRGLDELDERYIIVGEVAKGGAEIQRIKIDRRAIRKLDVELKGVGSAAALEEVIKTALRNSGFSFDDIVKLNISGRIKPGLEPELPDDFLQDEFFSIDYNFCNFVPDYDIEALLDESNVFPITEKKFAQHLMRRLKEESNEERKKILKKALYYGLDALRLKEVKPHNED